MRYFYIIFLFSSFLLNSQTTSNNCVNKINGQVIDKSTDKGIPNAKVTITNLSGAVSTLTANNEGHFYFELACEDNRYTASTTVENYTISTKLLFLKKNIANDYIFSLNLYPIKEFVTKNNKKMIVAKTIDFLPNETKIDIESTKTLDAIYLILVKYPYLKVEIGFHTDSRGIEKDLLRLSGERAEVCAQYLVRKGIDESRLISKGYGASQLLNECKKGIKCSNKKHLVNRRSEFVIIP